MAAHTTHRLSPFVHQFPALPLSIKRCGCEGFRLGHGSAIALTPAKPMQLSVNRGTLWLTRHGDGRDYFLGAALLGADSAGIGSAVIRLRAGEAWVIEPVGDEARFELDALPALAPAAAALAATPTPVLRAAAAGFDFLAGFLALAARKAASIASRAQGAMKCRASIASSGAVT